MRENPDYGEVVNSQNTTAKTASTFHAVSKFGNSTREDVLMKHREISGVFELGFCTSTPLGVFMLYPNLETSKRNQHSATD